MVQVIRKISRLLLIMAAAAGFLIAVGAMTGQMAFADGGAYSRYIPTDEDDAEALELKTVYFSRRHWFVIEDNSTSATSGTLTLLMAYPLNYDTAFSESGSNQYSGSKVRRVLDDLISNGSFANVVKAIRRVRLTDVSPEVDDAGLYLLSASEASALPEKVRQYQVSVDTRWWLRTPGSDPGLALSVDAASGVVDTVGSNVGLTYGLRPAMQLDLSKVIFDSEYRDFWLPIEELTLTPASLELTAGGDAVQLEVSMHPFYTDDRLNWTVTQEDECVSLYVGGPQGDLVGPDDCLSRDSSYYVQGVRPGTATITVTAGNYTEDTRDDLSATCTVTVKAPQEGESTIALNMTPLNRIVQNDDFYGDGWVVRLTASAWHGSVADQTVIWETDDLYADEECTTENKITRGTVTDATEVYMLCFPGTNLATVTSADGSKTAYREFTLTKFTKSMTLAVTDANIGYPATATAVLGDRADGTVTFYLDDDPTGSPVEIRDGVAEAVFSTEGLEPGEHRVRAEYPGDDNYNATTARTSFRLTPLAPVFAPVDRNYTQPDAKPLTIVNGSEFPVEVASVALSGTGADAFILNSTDGTTIEGETWDNTAYTIRPKADLPYGTYTATVTVTYADQSKVEDEVSFSVLDIPVDETKPRFAAHSLILSGSIGVRFYVKLPDREYMNYDSCSMTFSLYNEDKVRTVDFSEAEKVTAVVDGETVELYVFDCYVNSVQMADEITAELHYDEYDSDRNLVEAAEPVTETYSAREYIRSFRKSEGQYDQKTQDLVKALGEYGYYAQLYLSNIRKWTLGIEGQGKDHVAMNDYGYTPRTYSAAEKAAAAEALANNKISVSRCSKIEKVTYSLILDSDTKIYLYFQPKSGYRGGASATIDGKSARVTKNNGRFLVEIPDIAAHRLGTTCTVELVTGGLTTTVNISTLSYAQAVLASSKDEKAINAMMALYNYSTATKAMM